MVHACGCSAEQARFCWAYSEHMGTMTDTRKQKAEKASEMPIKLTVRGEHADRIVGSPSWKSSINYNRSIPENLKLSQIGSSPLPPPFRGLHSPGVRKHCQIIFACYFRKSSIKNGLDYIYIQSKRVP